MPFSTIRKRRRRRAEPLSSEPFLFAGDPPGTGTAVLRADLPTVRPWSAEVPELYTLIVSLRDVEGHEVEATRTRVGFRTVQVRDRELLVNGRAVTIRGVNRHEHHDRFGSAVPRETVEQDVTVLKAFNVNAVRTSHYPPDPYFLELADTYGLYVIDEANIEAHANYHDPLRRSALPGSVCRPGEPDGAARPQPPEHHRLVARQRDRATDPTTTPPRLGCVASTRPAPLHYEGAIAADWAAGHPSYRPGLPDVPVDRPHRRVGDDDDATTAR